MKNKIKNPKGAGRKPKPKEQLKPTKNIPYRFDSHLIDGAIKNKGAIKVKNMIKDLLTQLNIY